eukprot:3903815-Amphidinium_carterae.2
MALFLWNLRHAVYHTSEIHDHFERVALVPLLIQTCLWQDMYEAIDYINARETPLALYVFSRNQERVIMPRAYSPVIKLIV